MVVGCAAPPGLPLATEWTIRDTGITLSPPGSMAPTISSDDAYRLCLTHVAACDMSSPTRISLALMTDTGSNIVPAGTLVWAITWLGVTCRNSGGGPVFETPSSPANLPATSPSPQRCDMVAFVDAHAGTFYFTDTGPQ